MNSFLTIDLSKRGGIKKAAELGLFDSGLADIISSKRMLFATAELFDSSRQGRAFALLRHPVDQAIQSYNSFLQSESNSGESLTLQQFVSSPFMKSNWLTETLSTVTEVVEQIDGNHLNYAKELLRKKFIVGLNDELEQSIRLFVNYFRWYENADQNCASKIIAGHRNMDESFYKKVLESKYDVEVGSNIYEAIVAKNQYDIELYWYAFDLHMAQLKMLDRDGEEMNIE
jgi:hypothetical protein